MTFSDCSKEGTVYVLKHLESERGKELNGRRCQVVGSDSHPSPTSDIKLIVKHLSQRRVHVKLLNADTLQPEGGGMKVKPQNLLDPKYGSTAPSSTSRTKMSDEQTLNLLNAAMDRGKKEGYAEVDMSHDFLDTQFHYKFIEQYLPDRLPPPSKCMDSMVPDDIKSDGAIVRETLIPCCVGDGLVDFARFGTGLMGSKDEDCAICRESLEAGSLRLPCGHTFHVDCTKDWLETNGTCPICRGQLPNPWQVYFFDDVKAHIQRRMEEWYQTGMCELCQAAYQEKDPLVEAYYPDGTQVCMTLSQATARGLRVSQRVQGKIYDTLNLQL